VVGQDIRGSKQEQAFVVSTPLKLSKVNQPARQSRFGRLDFKNRRIEILFARKMTKDCDFIYARSKGDLSSGRTPKAFLGKQSNGSFENLLADIAGGRRLRALPYPTGGTTALQQPSRHLISPSSQEASRCLLAVSAIVVALANDVNRQSRFPVKFFLKRFSLLWRVRRLMYLRDDALLWFKDCP